MANRTQFPRKLFVSGVVAAAVATDTLILPFAGIIRALSWSFGANTATADYQCVWCLRLGTTTGVVDSQTAVRDSVIHSGRIAGTLSTGGPSANTASNGGFGGIAIEFPRGQSISLQATSTGITLYGEVILFIEKA